MSAMPKLRAKKMSYHHGDLRPALIGAGVKVLRKEGLHALSLRRVAREARVSPAAPYRHFNDKHALLAAISESGFRQLHGMLEAARKKSPGDLDAAGQAYLKFALQQPENYRLMFTQSVMCEGEPEESLRQAGEQAFNSLVQTIHEGIQSGKIVAVDSAPLALSAWALVHGVAMLLIDGAVAKPPYDKIPPAQILELCQSFFREGWRSRTSS
jgi:AcrR family transcriptional regulator